jgi:hypothetical protein
MCHLNKHSRFAVRKKAVEVVFRQIEQRKTQVQKNKQTKKCETKRRREMAEFLETYFV